MNGILRSERRGEGCLEVRHAKSVAQSADAVADSSRKHPLLDLQRAVGNQAVQRLLQQKATGGFAVLGGPQPAQGVDGPSVQPQPAQVPAQPQPAAQPKPFTAIFSIAQGSSRAHTVCNIPEIPGCVVKWTKWRLVDAKGAPVMGQVTVSEQFTKVSGPDDVYNKLKPQSSTSDKGFFDDCFGLCVPDGFAAFTLEVEQNHLVDGQVVSKNLITYSPSGISLRSCQRNEKGFGPPCRRY